ncbi:MAG: hypothetical protein ABJ333_16445 [Algoriphagus sp.]|uniref:hypothetical protein n=1 Tax=Algoriphagus sp. TaxID=1872435 RepID=UPI0032850147
MTTLLIKSRSDYSKLYDLIRKDFFNNEIRIILQQKFLLPFDILVLTQFIIHELTQNCDVYLEAENDGVLKYIQAIGLLGFCQKNHSESTEINEIPSFTAMPIKRLTRETMDYYINKTQIYFESICHGKDLGVLNIALAELINNVHDHAKSPIDSYVFCQYYPTNGEIIIAVSDLGIGIPYSVNSFMKRSGKPLLSLEDSIKWALEFKKTTQSMPHNAGRGLDTIASFLETIQGEWSLYSDSVKMESSPPNNKFLENPVKNFKGTIIEISIKVSNLEEKNVEDSFNWDI